MTHAHLSLELECLGAIGRVNFLIRDEFAVGPFMTIDLERVTAYTAVSITGNVEVDERTPGTRRKKKRVRDRDFVYLDGALTNGAIAALRQHFPSTELEEFTALWRRWHLNGYRPGTRRQLELAGFFSGESTLDFARKARVKLEESGDLIDRGFEFASGFLVELVSPEILNELQARCVALGAKDA